MLLTSFFSICTFLPAVPGGSSLVPAWANANFPGDWTSPSASCSDTNGADDPALPPGLPTLSVFPSGTTDENWVSGIDLGLWDEGTISSHEDIPFSGVTGTKCFAEYGDWGCPSPATVTFSCRCAGMGSRNGAGDKIGWCAGFGDVSRGDAFIPYTYDECAGDPLLWCAGGAGRNTYEDAASEDSLK